LADGNICLLITIWNFDFAYATNLILRDLECTSNSREMNFRVSE
jgi:hypothetical protein